MTLVDRFLKYVSFDTQSDESTGLTPSTPKQMVFAEYLKKELESLGLEDITLDEHGYLFATLPANIDKKVPTIGFIAHMDTSPDMTGKDVTPRIVEKYDGSDIVLCTEENVVLSPSQFPELLDHKGEDLIVTNGKTLLGADDKAGIAEIVSAMAYLKEHPEIKHGKIRIGFNQIFCRIRNSFVVIIDFVIVFVRNNIFCKIFCACCFFLQSNHIFLTLFKCLCIFILCLIITAGFCLGKCIILQSILTIRFFIDRFL